MSDTPSPNPPPPAGGTELAIPVSDRVQIQNVLIIESHAKRGEDEAFAGVGFNHKITGVEFSKEEETGEMGVQITIVLAATKDGKVQRDPALLLMAKLMLNYKISSFEGLTDENLRAFANTNGVFNAWPYWREFVQNMTVRMGLPPVVAPVFRIRDVAPPPPAGEPRETASSAKASDEPNTPSE